jgi:hypothetical protein
MWEAHCHIPLRRRMVHFPWMYKQRTWALLRWPHNLTNQQATETLLFFFFPFSALRFYFPAAVLILLFFLIRWSVWLFFLLPQKLDKKIHRHGKTAELLLMLDNGLLVMYGTFPNRSYSNGSCRIVRYFS